MHFAPDTAFKFNSRSISSAHIAHSAGLPCYSARLLYSPDMYCMLDTLLYYSAYLLD